MLMNRKKKVEVSMGDSVVARIELFELCMVSSFLTCVVGLTTRKSSSL